MSINITTPALLFPAITLLLLAYTNRFLAVASLIRALHKKGLESKDGIIVGQISNLRTRIRLIKWMQIFGVISFFFCVFSMFMVFNDFALYGNFTFGISLVSLLISLILSLRKLQISTKALELELGDMEYGQ